MTVISHCSLPPLKSCAALSAGRTQAIFGAFHVRDTRSVVLVSQPLQCKLAHLRGVAVGTYPSSTIDMFGASTEMYSVFRKIEEEKSIFQYMGGLNKL